MSYLKLDENDDSLVSPAGPVELTSYFKEQELLSPWQLEPTSKVYLNIVTEGFFYTW